MSIRARLKRLERESPSPGCPFFIITRYADETDAQARAAYPELPFPPDMAEPVKPIPPGRFELHYRDALVWYMPRSGTRPAVRPADDAPGYDPRGLGAVLREIDGKTATIGAWKEQTGLYP